MGTVPQSRSVHPDFPWCMLGGSAGTVPLGYACVYLADHDGPCAPHAAGAPPCTTCGTERLIAARRGLTVCPTCDFPKRT